MSIDQNSAGEETKSDDIDDLGPVSPSANDPTTSIVGLWDIAFIHAFTCTFSALDDPGLHAPPNFQPEVIEMDNLCRSGQDLVMLSTLPGSRGSPHIDNEK